MPSNKGQTFKIIRSGLSVDSHYDHESRVPLWSTCLQADNMTILIDPVLPPKATGIAVHCVLITNTNHERGVAAWIIEENCPVVADPVTSTALHFSCTNPNDIFPKDWQLIPIQGAAPGEVALWVPSMQHLALGDALINLDSTGFSLLPEKYCEDQNLLKRSLIELLKFDVSSISFAHGAPIIENSAFRLKELLCQ